MAARSIQPHAGPRAPTNISISRIDFVKRKCYQFVKVAKTRSFVHGCNASCSASPDPCGGRIFTGGPYGTSKAARPAGRLPFRRFVFDAAHLHEQMELVKRLKANGCEIVLDPNFAEMATIGRFGSSSLQKLPWANLDRPWAPDDFAGRRNQDAAKAIADFAVKAGVDAVLAPTHLLEKASDAWRAIDLRLCEALRHELDQNGGSDIAVDYQLITTSTLLKDAAYRASTVTDLRSMPVENVWVRASGFGATATGAGTRHFIESVRGLLDLDRPLVVDMAGGFAALSAVAFGAVGGSATGLDRRKPSRPQIGERLPPAEAAPAPVPTSMSWTGISKTISCRRSLVRKAGGRDLAATTLSAALMVARI